MKCDKCNGTGRVVPDRLVGSMMRKYRKRNGISLRELAYRMGISHPYLSQLESGKRHWTTALVKLYQSKL